MGWTNKSTIDLIELYKSQKVLWDPKHDEYYNKFSKNEAWDFIAKEMQMDAEECKRKMISLLASLRREKVKIRKCQLAGKKRFRSSWFAFDSLAWLLDKHNTDTNTVPMLTTNLSGLIKDARGDEADLINEESHNVLKIVPCNRKSSINLYENKSTTNDNQAITNDTFQTEEECNFFGKFVISKLRNYPIKTRSAVQHAISNILYNADQGKMENFRFNNNNFTSLAEEIESLNDAVAPNFYSVLLNATTNGVKQEFLNNEAIPCHNIE